MRASARWLPVAAILATGCATQPQPSVPVPGDENALAQVVVSAHLPAPLSIDGLTVHFDEGRRQWVVRGGELEHVSGNVWRDTPQPTASAGVLRVRFELEDHGGRIVSEGAVDLPLKPDWIHGVDIHAASEDPRGSCFGCLGSVRFPLDASARSPAADAIYVVWGGNSISSPVVY